MRRFIIIIIVFLLSGTVGAQTGWFWQHPLPQGNTLVDLYVFDKNHVLAIGGAGTIMKTADAGMNWDIQHYLCDMETYLISCCFVDESTGWVGIG